MLRRDFCLLSIGSLLVGSVGIQAKESILPISTHNITYKHVNLKNATYIAMCKGPDSKYGTYYGVSDEYKDLRDRIFEQVKKHSKNIVCFLDERNKRFSICYLDKEFDNDYLIVRPYQQVGRWEHEMATCN